MPRRFIWANAVAARDVPRHGARHNVPVIVVNQVGGNDQVVFDGSSFAMDAAGNVIASGASFREDLIVADTATRQGDRNGDLAGRMRSRLRSAGAGHARLHPQMRFQPGADRPERRHRFLAHGRSSRWMRWAAKTCAASAMPGPFSSDHSVTDARAHGGTAGHSLRPRFHHAGLRGNVPHAGARFSKAASPTWPKKIFRRGCAG